jgi:hypothetical protein
MFYLFLLYLIVLLLVTSWGLQDTIPGSKYLAAWLEAIPRPCW